MQNKFIFLLWLSSLCTAVTADTFSDLLVTLDPDGRQYTAQHTLSSDGDLIVLELPPERTDLHVQFAGPERQTFEQAHRINPNRLTLWSGSAIVRYRHSYGSGLIKKDSRTHTLNAFTEHGTVSVDNPQNLNSNLGWIFPANATVVDFHDSAADVLSQAGRWQRTGSLLLYQQRGGPLANLSVDYMIQSLASGTSDPCLSAVFSSDSCFADIDGDQIPDQRDICLPDPASDQLSGLPARIDIQPSGKGLDELGCDNYPLIVLAGVRFESGQSYLDVAAREVLDRTALALQQVPERLFEVSAHTDNAGRVSHNQRLSENRADAVRHYLMLRGVSPNQLRATGRGETSPAYDNRLAAGRRANRRIELKRLN